MRILRYGELPLCLTLRHRVSANSASSAAQPFGGSRIASLDIPLAGQIAAEYRERGKLGWQV
jgi:hypothetical protein